MVLHYCGDSELTNGKTRIKNSKLTNGIAFFPQQMQSHKTLAAILTQNQESNAILRQKNNLKLYYENNLQKTKSKP